MRVGLTVSSTAHVAIIAGSLIGLPRPDPYDTLIQESVPVELVSIEEVTRVQAGIEDAEDGPKPATRVGEVEQNEAVENPDPDSTRTEVASLPPAIAPEPAPIEEPTPEVTEPAPAETAEPAPEAEPAEPDAVPTPISRPRDIPRRPQRPPEPEQQNDTFDPTEIAALIDRSDEQNAQQQTITDIPQPQTPTLGAPDGTAGRISASEMDYLRQQISECWSPPVGAQDAAELSVVVRMQLSINGDLTGAPTVISTVAPGFAGQAAADSALRAVRRCAPYDLPQHKYDVWQTVEVTFDPSQMLR